MVPSKWRAGSETGGNVVAVMLTLGTVPPPTCCLVKGRNGGFVEGYQARIFCGAPFGEALEETRSLQLSGPTSFLTYPTELCHNDLRPFAFPLPPKALISRSLRLKMSHGGLAQSRPRQSLGSLYKVSPTDKPSSSHKMLEGLLDRGQIPTNKLGA